MAAVIWCWFGDIACQVSHPNRVGEIVLGPLIFIPLAGPFREKSTLRWWAGDSRAFRLRRGCEGWSLTRASPYSNPARWARVPAGTLAGLRLRRPLPATFRDWEMWWPDFQPV